MERELLGTPIAIGTGVVATAGGRIVGRAPARTYVIITDEAVAALPVSSIVEAGIRDAAPEARVLRQHIPRGESQKSRERWAALTDAMLAASCGRDTTAIALGGGVVGDLAGFVAATYMRGIPFVQIPTTLVAMVDAAIGGKTGVDTKAGKNLVGAFHQPSLVLVDPSLLATLPAAQVSAGMAEVLKHGVMADAAYFHRAARDAAMLAAATPTDAAEWWRGAAADDLVDRSIAIKSAVVAADERESGHREMLNFGHTVAHAIEVESDYSIPHGQAVSIGMLAECVAGETLGITSSDVRPALRRALEGAGLPATAPTCLDEHRLIDAMHADKKARGGTVRFALPERLGTAARVEGKWSVAISPMALRRAVRAVLRENPEGELVR
ncbi:MAG: 3-dehydroquinate synthase [Gemmatimonadaceae bacterium]|nr:3-dehydroquinate synthase [Gemmatimonadaceae bacterium]